MFMRSLSDRDDAVVGSLAIIHDASHINAQSRRVWRDTFLRVLALVFLITLTTLLIVALAYRRPDRPGRAVDARLAGG
jgi:hypothetical protein